MCGIYGMIAFGSAPLRAPDEMGRMAERLRHRGPDDHGVLVRPRAALGTERLRITDPHPSGAQPFSSPDSRVWLSCNGAIYNAGDLRRRYSDYPYRSASDVEPILPLYLDRGSESIADLDGMFAIALWDERERRLILARDRSGEKPLFYAQAGDEFWFASEIQVLLRSRVVRRAIDPEGIGDFIRLGYVREPRTMLRGIGKLEAGTVAIVTAEGIRIERYWRPDAVPVVGLDPSHAIDRLTALLRHSVEKQVVADVPVGVFTSGGLDSALLAVLAARALRRRRLHTFAVGFGDPSYDERSHAASVGALVGSRHVDVRATEASLEEALDVVTGRLAEPIADPAILPTYLLAQAAREEVGVVLSGEGADELFGGYPTYLGHRIAPRFLNLPPIVRRSVSLLIRALPASDRRVTLEFLLKRFVAHAELPLIERHVAWFGTGLPPDVLRTMPHPAPQPTIHSENPLREVMLYDYRTYLPDNLLTKVDRATMLVSLEARSPYLDRDVVAFALGLETGLKIRGLDTKWILKKVASRFLPAGIVRRRKRGLSVPVAGWLNGGLRPEVDRLLDRRRLERVGLLNASRVRQLLGEHRSGRANHARPLWALVILERWRERWLGD